MNQPRVKRGHKARLMQRYHPLSGSLKLILGGLLSDRKTYSKNRNFWSQANFKMDLNLGLLV